MFVSFGVWLLFCLFACGLLLAIVWICLVLFTCAVYLTCDAVAVILWCLLEFCCWLIDLFCSLLHLGSFVCLLAFWLVCVLLVLGLVGCLLFVYLLCIVVCGLFDFDWCIVWRLYLGVYVFDLFVLCIRLWFVGLVWVLWLLFCLCFDCVSLMYDGIGCVIWYVCFYVLLIVWYFYLGLMC